jgi:uncharacterized protein
MLIAFRVANFRSFDLHQTLSFEPLGLDSPDSPHSLANDSDSHSHLNPAALVVGPSGSGKSNLLLALAAMRDFVVGSAHFSETDVAARYAPFRDSPATKRATEFSIELSLDGIRYRYGFTHDRQRIVSEQLQVVGAPHDLQIYERHYDAATGAQSWLSPPDATLPDAWRETPAQTLVLSVSGRSDPGHLRALRHWFEHQLVLLLADGAAQMAAMAIALHDAEFRARILVILRTVDDSLADVRATFADASAAEPAPCPSIEFLYRREGASPVWRRSTEASPDALWLVLVVFALLGSTERDRLVAIDDFDTRLHTLVARFLLETVIAPGTNPVPAQLLIVSQSTALMDLDLLHPDELWLMELDQQHASRLKALLGPGRRAEPGARAESSAPGGVALRDTATSRNAALPESQAQQRHGMKKTY